MYFLKQQKQGAASGGEITFLTIHLFCETLFRFVINLPSSDVEDNFVQAVRVEKCLTEGDPCNLVTCDDSTTVCR